MADNNSLNILITATDDTRAGFTSARASASGFAQEVAATTGKLQAALSGVSVGNLSESLSAAGKSAAGMAEAMSSAMNPLQATLGGISKGVSVITSEIGKLSSTAAGLIAIVPIFEAISAASSFLTKSLQDASKETDNLNRISATFVGVGRGGMDAASKFTEKVKEMSRVTSYASQDVVQAFNYLSGIPRIANKDLIPALQTSIDFAAYSGRTIQEAALNVGWAAHGMYGLLRHVGFEVSEAAKSTGDFSKVLAEMQQRVSGQENAKMLSYAGGVGALEKAFNRAEKAIGHIIEPAIIPVLANLTDFFTKFGKEVEKALDTPAVKEFVGKLQKAFQEIADTAKAKFKALADYAKNIDFDKFLNELTGMISTIKTVGSVVLSGLGWLVSLPTWVKQAVLALIGLRIAWGVVGGLVRWFGEGLGLLQTKFTQLAGLIKLQTAAIREQTAAYTSNAAAANASAGAQTRAATAPAVAQRVSGGKVIPAPGTVNPKAVGVGSALGGMAAGMVGGMAAGAAADAITSTKAVGGALATVEEKFKGITSLDISGWLAPLVNGIVMIAGGMAGNALQLVGFKGALGAISGVAKGVGAALTGIVSILSLFPAMVGVAVGAIWWMASDWAKSKKKIEEQTKKEEMSLLGLVSTKDEAKSSLKEQDEAINKGKDTDKAAEETAKVYAKAGHTLEEYKKAWEGLGRDVPASAEEAFTSVSDRIKNFDADLERSQSEVESWKTRIKLMQSEDPNLTMTGAAAKLRMEALTEKGKTPEWKNERVKNIDEATSQLSRLGNRVTSGTSLEQDKAAVKKMLKDAGDTTEDSNTLYVAKYKTAELEQDAFKLKREELEKKITESTAKGIEEQKKLYRDFVKERTKLDEEMYALSQKAHEINKTSFEATLQPQQKVMFSLVDLKAKYQEAMATMASNPERAGKMFEDVAGKVGGLIKDVKSLKMEIIGLQDANRNTMAEIERARQKRDLTRRGVSEGDQSKIFMYQDISRADELMKRARLAQKQGNDELMRKSATEASELYKKAALTAPQAFEGSIAKAQALGGGVSNLPAQWERQKQRRVEDVAESGINEASNMLINSKKQEVYNQERVNKEAQTLGLGSVDQLQNIKKKEIAMYNEFVESMKVIITQTKQMMDKRAGIQDVEGKAYKQSVEEQQKKIREKAGIAPAETSVPAGIPMLSERQIAAEEAKKKPKAASPFVSKDVAIDVDKTMIKGMTSEAPEHDIQAMMDLLGLGDGESKQIGLGLIPGDEKIKPFAGKGKPPVSGLRFKGLSEFKDTAGDLSFVDKEGLDSRLSQEYTYMAQKEKKEKEEGTVTKKEQDPAEKMSSAAEALEKGIASLPSIIGESVKGAVSDKKIIVYVKDGEGVAQAEAW